MQVWGVNFCWQPLLQGGSKSGGGCHPYRGDVWLAFGEDNAPFVVFCSSSRCASTRCVYANQRRREPYFEKNDHNRRRRPGAFSLTVGLLVSSQKETTILCENTSALSFSLLSRLFL